MCFKLWVGLFAFVCFVGCDKDDDSVSDPFFGSWEIVEATGVAAESNIGTVYTFEESGSVAVKGFGITNNGTYTKSESEIVITLSGIDLMFEYFLSGSRLTLDNRTAEQVFVLEKR